MRGLSVFVAAAGTIPKTLTKDKLLNLLKFYFEDKTVGLSSMKWDAITDLVKRNSEEMTSVGTATDFDDDIGEMHLLMHLLRRHSQKQRKGQHQLMQ